MEPLELSLDVVTLLQSKAVACDLGSDAQVLLANVPHPGVIKVLTLRDEGDRDVIKLQRCLGTAQRGPL